MKRLFNHDRASGNAMRLLLAVVAGALLAACASIGRPEGGPRDYDAPVFVRSVPAPSGLNVDHNKIEIFFDENVQLDEPATKVVVSPAQRNQPVVTASGRKVTVELRDTLLPNTTYTIDFTDAISDLNEKNPLDGFAIDFSTGESIDTLRISGMVLDASNLEPAQGMLVGAYLNPADSALTTLPFERITKTNQRGQFTLRNLAPGTYRVFALNDNNRDYHWDRSEDIAFYDTPVTPTASSMMVNDTIMRADSTDSIVPRRVTVFKPNDVLLTWFNENYKAQYLMSDKRVARNRITLIMSAPLGDTLPSIRAINGPRKGRDILSWAVLEASAGHDTLNYWISDSAVINQDSLSVEARYPKTDSLDRIVWTVDTLRFNMRPVKNDKKKKKDGEKADTVKKVKLYDFKVISPSLLDLNAPIVFRADVPIASLDTAAIHLEQLVDTVWTPVAPPVIERSRPYSTMSVTARHAWEPGGKYRLTVDSAAVSSIYGLHNGTITHDFTVRKLEDYAALYMTIQGLDGRPAMAELLSGDEPIMAVPVIDGVASFEFVNPGTYYVRIYIDSNGNGKWDTGNVAAKLQPEEVSYYHKKLNLRKNWDVQQTWNIYEQPLDMQKPIDIKKNKPTPTPEERRRQEEEDRKNGKKTGQDNDEDDLYTDPNAQWGYPPLYR